MALQLYSGTKLVDATEWSLTTNLAFAATADTTVGSFQLVLDTSDMIASDVLQIRVYEKARAGDTQRLLEEWVIFDAQNSPLWVSPALALMHGWDFTLDCLAGTSITVLWSIRDTIASAAVVMATGGIQSLSFTAGAIDGAAFPAINEHTTGAPADNADIPDMIKWMYMSLINANASTSTERRIKNAAGTVLAKATQSDNGTTFDQGKLVTGP